MSERLTDIHARHAAAAAVREDLEAHGRDHRAALQKRRDLIVEFLDAGMTTRQVAPLFGITQQRVVVIAHSNVSDQVKVPKSVEPVGKGTKS